MQTCDVLIVGGGPAGSSCAAALVQAGMDVLVLDRAVFPRDKTCAGWVTPAVFAACRLDPAEYGDGRTCQPITAFRVGRIGSPAVDLAYGRPVGYGVCRSQFDHYLLDRSAARLCLGEAVRQVERRDGGWVVNGRFSAPMLVAAGGHFCPVARWLDGQGRTAGRVVAAQGIEFAMDPRQRADCRAEAGVPELYFCPDLAGYGWCFRKGDLLNVGLGREDRSQLSRHAAAFLSWLKKLGRIPQNTPEKLHGHAYFVHRHSPRKLSVDGLLAVGDAAGLAYAESGEGIGPAVESGRMAAAAIAAAGGKYDKERLAAYETAIFARFGPRGPDGPPRRLLPESIRRFAAARLLATRWFARRVVLDRWFLRESSGGDLGTVPIFAK